MPILALHLLQINETAKITTMFLDSSSLFLIAGSKDGIISVFNYKEYKKEKQMNLISAI